MFQKDRFIADLKQWLNGTKDNNTYGTLDNNAQAIVTEIETYIENPSEYEGTVSETTEETTANTESH